MTGKSLTAQSHDALINRPARINLTSQEFTDNLPPDARIVNKGSSRGGEPQFKRQAAKVYEQYAIDLLELEPARGNVKYLLVGVDVLSCFMNAIPIKDKCARTVATALEQRIFPTLARIPDIIISDNGPEFRAKVFEELLLKYSIKHFMTIPHFLKVTDEWNV